MSLLDAIAMARSSPPESFQESKHSIYNATGMIRLLRNDEEILGRGLNALEFATVLFAKGSRLHTVENLREEEISDATRAAFAHRDDPKEAIEAICSLDGVRVSTGSAILTWCLPHEYAILDSRSYKAATSIGIVETNYNWSTDSGYYVRYLDCVRSMAAEIDRTPQEVDLWLYNRGGDA